jgi:hypothetical protein
MFKYFFCFLIIYFLRGMLPVYSQTNGDSVETVVIDPDSIYRPVMDSGYLFLDSIREVDHRQVNSYLLNPDYAYANHPEYWKKQPHQDPGIFVRILNSALLRWMIFLGVITVVLYGIYQLAKENNFSWLTRKGKQNSSDSEQDLPDEKMDYDTAIQKYQGEGNYRLAVRYMYLRLIHTAREKGGIQFRDSSTNAEIVRAFRTHTKADEFRFLVMAYEYVFYGGFIPKQELFEVIKNKFEVFQQTLSV